MKSMYRPTTQSHKGRQSLPGPDDTLYRTLPNGITLMVRENFASPAVVVSGYLEFGAQDEPADVYGLTGFTADVMQRGTRRRPFGDLYEEVESIGAAFGLNTGTHMSSFGAKGLAEHLPLLLDILNDVLRYPSFDEQQVEKVRTEIITDLHERANDTRRTAHRLFYELAYPKAHPYHWSQLGYEETIQRITRDDLVAFHERYMAPQGMVLVIVGGIKAEDAAQIATDVFGTWDHHRPERSALPEVPALTERREKHVTIADKSQSSLVLGWPGPERRHEDFIPCFVANTVLGIFGMYGRLGKRVREENGLAYYVYSKLSGGTGPGPWRILGGFDPHNVDQGLALILDEVRRLRDERVPRSELEDSQSYLTGSLPLHLETNEGVARTLVNIERYDLGLDYLHQYQEMIQAITAKQIQTVAQRWMDPDKIAIASAGPGAPEQDEPAV